MKTKFIGIIVFILLCHAIIPNFIYATDLEYDINTQTMDDMQYSEKSWNKYKDDGKADINTSGGTKTKDVKESFSLGAGLASAVGALLLGPVLMVSSLLTLIARGVDNVFLNGNTLVNWYTIEDTVFGNIDLFNADYFTLESEIDSDVNNVLKKSVATWYYILRIIAVLLGLLMLIYVGINMALSTIASALAKYKEMLKDWLASMILLFALPYIIGMVNLLCNGFVDLLCIIKERVISQRIRTKYIMAIIKFTKYNIRMVICCNSNYVFSLNFLSN